MGSDTHRAEIVRLQRDLASLQSELGKQEGLAANARAEAAKKRQAAMDTIRCRSAVQSARCGERLGDTRRNRRTVRNGRYSRARSTARRIHILARPSGRRAPRRNPEVRSRASASRSSAVSFRARRRSFKTSCRSSSSVRSAPSRRTTSVGATPSQPRAVERGTPRSGATVMSPVRWTRCLSRWS